MMCPHPNPAHGGTIGLRGSIHLAAVAVWKTGREVAFLTVLALAIGVGSATAIYTVINALLLKPIPFEHGERFVCVLGREFRRPQRDVGSDIERCARISATDPWLRLFGWFVLLNYNLTAPGQPQHLNGVEVTPSLVNGMRVTNHRFEAVVCHWA
jgi:hypothetical protein